MYFCCAFFPLLPATLRSNNLVLLSRVDMAAVCLSLTGASRLQAKMFHFLVPTVLPATLDQRPMSKNLIVGEFLFSTITARMIDSTRSPMRARVCVCTPLPAFPSLLSVSGWLWHDDVLHRNLPPQLVTGSVCHSNLSPFPPPPTPACHAPSSWKCII